MTRCEVLLTYPVMSLEPVGTNGVMWVPGRGTRFSTPGWLGGVCALVMLSQNACEADPDVVGRSVALGSGGDTGGSVDQGGAPSSGGTPNSGGGPGGTGGEASQLPGGLLSLTGDLVVHDPSLIEEDGIFYAFHTGPGVAYKTSTDLLNWQDIGSVFSSLPDPVVDVLPDVQDLWAPDISYRDGLYHLYYAASTFGSGRSCVGHATKSQLGSDEAWTVRDNVICSNIDSDVEYDAIDPSAFVDNEGRPWLVFGSYGSGIKLIGLTESGDWDQEPLSSLASRPVEVAIQAAHLHYHNSYYYLLTTFDACCRGVSSTSYVTVGRAETVEGPYFDREGIALLEGGGTTLVEGNDRFRAVGASTILTTDQRAYLCYHAYDANSAGTPTLRISELSFDDEGWPIVEGP